MNVITQPAAPLADRASDVKNARDDIDVSPLQNDEGAGKTEAGAAETSPQPKARTNGKGQFLDAYA